MCDKIKIYTSRINYSGDIKKIDITRKSGTRYKALAPTWDMVMGLKNEQYTERMFKELYTKIMNSCKQMIKVMLEESGNSCVLVCYCPKDTFCHRILLAKFIEEHFNAEYIGEI